LNDKFRIVLLIAVFIAAVLGAAIYFFGSSSMEFWDFSSIGIVLLLLIGAGVMIFKKAKSVKSGLPVEDELARKVNHKAGYYAFLGSMYFGLALMFFRDSFQKFGLPDLACESLIGLQIVFTGLVFIVSYFVLDWKGSVE